MTIGEHLRTWRQRRGLSQLALAVESDVSSRHLSFIETGKSHPSRDMVLRLAECLDIPLRVQNVMLLSAGLAPAYSERPVDDPEMAVIASVLKAYEPYPALAVDRRWNLLMANAALAPLLADVAPHLLEPPVNVLRVSLDPEGLAARIDNLEEWRAHVLARLRGQAQATGDPELEKLRQELAVLPAPLRRTKASIATTRIAVPLRLRSDAGVLSFLSTTTVFGTPLDVTLSEIAIETFLPFDEATKEALNRAPS